jgi:hypothetical protein
MGMIVRDPVDMKKFADQLDAYCRDMKKSCTSLKRYTEESRSVLKDDASKALKPIDEAADSILHGLPELEEIMRRLRNSAKTLEQAQGIWR